MTPSDFSSSIVARDVVLAPTAVGGIVGDLSANNPTGRIVYGAGQENYGGVLSTFKDAAKRALGFVVEPYKSVAMPLAKGVEKAGAGAQAALAGAGSAVAALGEGARESAIKASEGASRAIFWVVLLGGVLVVLWGMSVVKGATK